MIHPRPGQEATRKHVLGTVYELISEYGIESLSMRQVAEASGHSTGTITYHFGNKESLLIAALESAYELPADWEQYKGSAAAQLRRLVLGYVMRSQKDRFWLFWINYLALSTRNTELAARQRLRYERQERFWTKLIQDAVQMGEFRSDIEPASAAKHLLVLAHGLLARQLLQGDPAVRAEANAMLTAHIDGLRR